MKSNYSVGAAEEDATLLTGTLFRDSNGYFHSLSREKSSAEFAFEEHVRFLRQANCSLQIIDAEMEEFLCLSHWAGYNSYSIDRKDSDKGDDTQKSLICGETIRIPLAILAQENNDLSKNLLALDSGCTRQLRKDIGRDRILINGGMCIGAGQGLEGTMKSLLTECENIITRNGLPLLPNDILERFCEAILIKSSRTASGGIALSTMQRYFDLQSKYLAVPVISLTPPAQINLYLGAVQGRTGWGLVGKIRCEFAYDLRCMTDLVLEGQGSESSIEHRIVISYEDYVVCKISLTGKPPNVYADSLRDAVVYISVIDK